jgi:hypothetical protein
MIHSSRDVFPSPFGQLLSLTGDKDAWMLGTPYSDMMASMGRLSDIRAEGLEVYPGTYGRLVKINGWVTSLLKGQDLFTIQIGPYRANTELIPTLVYVLTVTASSRLNAVLQVTAIRSWKHAKFYLGYEDEDARAMGEAFSEEFKRVEEKSRHLIRPRVLYDLIQIFGDDDKYAGIIADADLGNEFALFKKMREVAGCPLGERKNGLCGGNQKDNNQVPP